MKMTRHRCIGCKKVHEEEEWRWRSMKLDGKTVYWCHTSLACEGCKTIHPRNGFSRSYTNPSRVFPGYSLEICSIWARPTKLTPQQKMKNMSPEDVLSGVPFGGERASFFGEDSRTDWSSQHKEEVGELTGALNDL